MAVPSRVTSKAKGSFKPELEIIEPQYVEPNFDGLIEERLLEKG